MPPETPQPPPAPHHGETNLRRAHAPDHRNEVLVVVFTDQVGSTALRNRLGDAASHRLEDQHRLLMQQALETCDDGQIVKTEGDGHLLVFHRPGTALQFALRAVALHRAARAADWPDLPPFRTGVHIGTVIVEPPESAEARRQARVGDVLGLQVDIAARIMDLCAGDQILCSRPVFDDARQALKGSEIDGVGDLNWVSHGPYLFKGREEPLSIGEVGEAGLASFATPEGSEKASRLDYSEEVQGWRPGPDAILPGTNWVMREKLGEGGFGEVWLARDRTLPARATVFKFCTRQNKVGSLRRELDVFNRLASQAGGKTPPGIVEVLGAHDSEAPYYIQLEYVAGGDLHRWLEAHGEQASFRARLDLAIQMARALARVHAAEVTHRDVKPSNYLCEPPDDPAEPPTLKLSDFGIGQAAFDDALAAQKAGGDTVSAQGGGHVLHTQTISSAAVGAFFFIAPELVMHGATTPGTVARRAGPASDIYSLGVSLYQVFAASPTVVPGPGLRHVADPILRQDLEACLDQAPEARPTAEELSDLLERYDERREAHNAAEREAERKRHEETRRLLEETRQAHRREAEARRETETQAYCHAMLLADRYFADGDYALGVDLLWQTPEHLRHWEWGFLAQQTQNHELALEGHTDEVLGVAPSPDGRWIASWSKDHTVRIWDARDGRPVSVLEHQEDLVDVFWHPDGERVFTATGHAICFWSAASCQLLSKTVVPGYQEIVFSRDGQYVAIAGNFRIAALYCLDGAALSLVFHEVAPVVSRYAAFHPGRRLIAFAGLDGFRVYELGETLRSVFEHDEDRGPEPGIPRGMAFSPDGHLLAVAPRSGEMQIWNTGPWKKVTTCQLSRGHTYRLNWSPDSSRIILLIEGTKRAEVLDVVTGTVLHKIEGHRSTVRSATWTPNEDQVVTASSDGSIRLHSVRARKEKAVFLGHNGAVTSAVKAGNTERILSASTDKTVRVWAARKKVPWLRELVCGDEGHLDATYSEDGELIATVSEGSMVVLWEARSGKRLAETRIAGHFHLLAFSPSREVVAVFGTPNLLYLWHIESPSRETQRVELPNPRRIESLDSLNLRRPTFSADSKFLLVGRTLSCSCLFELESSRPRLLTFLDPVNPVPMSMSRSGEFVVREVTQPDGSLFPAVVSLFSGEPVCRLRTWGGAQATFSPNEDYLLVAGPRDGPGYIYNLRDPYHIAEVPREVSPVRSVGFSPDGKCFAVGTDEGITRVRSTQDAALQRELHGHRAAVMDVQFSPDGQRILTSSLDNTAKIWDVESGRLLATLRGHRDALIKAEFSPDGRQILTVSRDGTARIWTAAPWRTDDLPGAPDMPCEKRMHLYVRQQREALERESSDAEAKPEA